MCAEALRHRVRTRKEKRREKRKEESSDIFGDLKIQKRTSQKNKMQLNGVDLATRRATVLVGTQLCTTGLSTAERDEPRVGAFGNGQFCVFEIQDAVLDGSFEVCVGAIPNTHLDACLQESGEPMISLARESADAEKKATLIADAHAHKRCF